MARGLINHIEIKCVASHDIYYKYQCEHCNTVTDIYNKSIMQKANKIIKLGGLGNIYNRRGRIDDIIVSAPEYQIQIDEEAKKRLTEVIILLKDIINKRSTKIIYINDQFILNIYNDIFAFGKSCPNCGNRQSWYPAYQYKKPKHILIMNNAIGFFVFSFIISVIIIGFITKNIFYNLFYALAVAVIFSSLGGIYGCLTYFLYYKKINNHIKKIKRINKPIVDWNDSCEFKFVH